MISSKCLSGYRLDIVNAILLYIRGGILLEDLEEVYTPWIKEIAEMGEPEKDLIDYLIEKSVWATEFYSIEIENNRATEDYLRVILTSYWFPNMFDVHFEDSIIEYSISDGTVVTKVKQEYLPTTDQNSNTEK